MQKKLNKISIQDWLLTSEKLLIKSESPRLDSELILSYVLNKDRTFLHSHNNDILEIEYINQANILLEQRIKNTPLAYIFKQKEFYGINFYINENVLIPRIESEDIVDLALNFITKNRLKNPKILDIGTGSGCIGLSVAHQLQDYALDLIDISPKALKIAKKNADLLNINANIYKSNLLENVSDKYNILIANLPYVNPDWSFIKNIEHEPKLALYANNNGLEVIYNFIDQLSTKDIIKLPSLILIESDISQQEEIKKYIKNKLNIVAQTKNYVTYFKVQQ